MNRKISLIALGSIYTFILYKSYHQDNIFRNFDYLLFGIPWIYIYIKTVLKEKNIYKTNRKLINLSGFILGILIFLINIGIYFYYENKVNSPSLIKARIFGGYTDFKKNGEYVIISGSWASRTHFYGKYEITDSIITVDRKGFDDVLTTDRFVIRKSDSVIKENYKNKEIMIDKYLIQIDNNGKEIKRKDYQNHFRLPILIDNLN